MFEQFKRKPKIKDKTLDYYKKKGLKESDVIVFRDTMLEVRETLVTLGQTFSKNSVLREIEKQTKGIESGQKIFQYLVENPLDLIDFDDFLYKDLPHLTVLVTNYQELDKQVVKYDEVNQNIQEVLALIEKVANGIQKDYHKTLFDSVKDIKNEIEHENKEN